MAGYQAQGEQLFPGEEPQAFLPWAWMREEDQQRHLTQPGPCTDCGRDDLVRVEGWLLCTYCRELRALRRQPDPPARLV